MKMELICRNYDTGKELVITFEAKEPEKPVRQKVDSQVELKVRTISGESLTLGDFQPDAFGVSDMFMKNFLAFAKPAKR
jgi:hypothetical protein